MIIQLGPNQVFIFGSNSTGFHGEGSAGVAMRGVRAIRSSHEYTPWRNDQEFLAAMNSQQGSPTRVGTWAIYGQARGFQVGHNGSSYAIVTVTHPGKRRSISRRDIYFQLVELWAFAKAHPELDFLMTSIGTGYAGYSHAEMQEVFDFLVSKHGQRSNVTWPRLQTGNQWS